MEPQDPTAAKTAETLVPEDGSDLEKPVEEATTSGEKEEEEAFLVSLYKFMKDRHTPIERIPHLGFKQINLWKIYKAVEKLGAYELVTGRRLWKNVYDELGGSPGSTSAATCTRRHYERLVLPYVRHLKGEDDKPLPPSKPRKQYKVSKGTETGEKSKRARKEKGRDQMPPDKVKLEVAASMEDARDAPEGGRVAEGCSSPAVPSPSPSGGCPSLCRPHTETYKRLFSSFYSKGNHPIMSPLAKKKLLAQVSKAESLNCHRRHGSEGWQSASNTGPGHEPPRPAAGHKERSPELLGAQDTAPSVGSEVEPIPSASPSRRDSQPCPQAKEGSPAPTVFTGCFHAYRSEVLKPVSCHPLWGYFSNLKDFFEPPSTFPSRSEEPEQPQDLRSKARQSWSGESQRGAACAAVKACWVPPRAGFASAEPRGKRGQEEAAAAFGPSAKLRAISPFIKEADSRDTGAGSPRGQQGLAKPKAVVASPGYATTLPQAPDIYKGAMLHLPASFGNPLEHLKAQGVPVVPSLSVNPFIVPAFPSPLVAASTQPSDLCRPLATGPGHYPASYESSLRHRVYPAATWHSQPTYASPHVPAFHRHAKL
ncbi:AT-rich interactive domain-containing protein 5A isoform X1 [Balearica regulorum gibbericeps]|uniref:AT-rich interactive domain-containing protein 5A isoform X1 n=1 Tax=Balearica regulorum gibbericeps TaxID=100784 RepID=UPI003F6366E7